MNVQQQRPCIVAVASLVGSAEIQGLVHTMGRDGGNDTGLSSKNYPNRQADISWNQFLSTTTTVG